MGRPTLYTNELAALFCSHISMGNSLRKVTAMKGMPSAKSIYNWFNKYPDFIQQYTRAKDDSADADADKIERIAEQVLKGTVDPQAARVAMDAYKWTAGKKRPRKYGDRIQQDIRTNELEHLTDDEVERELARATQENESVEQVTKVH